MDIGVRMRVWLGCQVVCNMLHIAWRVKDYRVHWKKVVLAGYWNWPFGIKEFGFADENR